MLKILVIGNGFDKAHGLKTGYADFIDWFQNVQSTYKDIKKNKAVSFPDSERDDLFNFKKVNPDEFTEVISAQDNFWISHFIKVRNDLGDKWLDFESEIEYLVNRIYNVAKAEDVRNIDYMLRGECSTAVDIPRFVNTRHVFEWLNKELRELTRVLEIYLCRYVNKSIDKNARIELFTNIKPNKLISFNYTSTYQDLYNFGIQTDYIHGKAVMKHTVDTCPLVLGFDDHYIDSADTRMELIPFEKYYQRIVYRNPNDYFSWVEAKDKYGNAEEKTVYFYGHSLSPADGDIIRLLIEAEKTKTIIFYRKDHEEDRASMIRNLAMILTPDGLIRRMGGANPTIDIVPV